MQGFLTRRAQLLLACEVFIFGVLLAQSMLLDPGEEPFATWTNFWQYYSQGLDKGGRVEWLASGKPQ